MSSAVVRYGVKRMAPVAIRYYKQRTFKRARVAGYVARQAVRYGPRVIRAVRGIQRRFRSKWSRRVQPNTKTSPLSIRQEIGSGLNYTVRNLATDQIRFPTSGTQGLVMARDNIISYLSGIKICEHFTNLSTTVPLEVHWALCQSKREITDPAGISAPGALLELTSEFFKDKSVQGSSPQIRTFSNAVIGTPYDFRYQCLPLNNDRFNVISHRKFFLAQNDSNGRGSMRHQRKFERYFKLGKTIKFKNMDDEVSTHPFFTFMWYQPLSGIDWPGDPPGSSWLQRSLNYTTFIRDKK